MNCKLGWSHFFHNHERVASFSLCLHPHRTAQNRRAPTTQDRKRQATQLLNSPWSSPELRNQASRTFTPPTLPSSSCPGTYPEKKPDVTELIWRESKWPEACHSAPTPGERRGSVVNICGLHHSPGVRIISRMPWSTPRSLLVCKQLRRVATAPFCIFRVPSLQMCACVPIMEIHPPFTKAPSLNTNRE